MSTGIKRPYEIMHELATGLWVQLESACKRIEVAGSVRRQKAICGDLEFVCIADGDHLNNRLNSWLASGKIRHVESGPKKTKRWGEKQKSFNMDYDGGPVQVDVFITTPEKWGYTYLVRTGSGGFSNRIVTPVGVRTHDGLPGMMPARFKFKGCLLYCNGDLCEVAEEEDIFRLFGMAYVEPQQRTDDYTPTLTPVVAPVKPVIVAPMATERQIYLPDELPSYPGRDGTREGARLAAVAAMRQKPTQAPTKRSIAGLETVASDGELGPMFEGVNE